MRKLGALVVGVVVGTGSLTSVAAQQPPPAQSIALAKEVAGLMTKANKECVAIENNSVFGGYVAALLVPGTKLTVVSARFKDTAAMVYKLYQKDCIGAYSDLSAAIDALDRVVIDDITADGLIAMPKKDTPKDGITIDNKTVKFDGSKDALKQAKMTPEDFAKQFSSADETYSKLLRLLSTELKK